MAVDVIGPSGEIVNPVAPPPPPEPAAPQPAQPAQAPAPLPPESGNQVDTTA